MQTDTNRAASLESGAALSGILALLVAERQERDGRGTDRTERILARAGLGDDQIAALVGHDASQVRTIIANETTVASPALPRAVIDYAERVDGSARRGPGAAGA
jgi:hypothetical protein